MLLLWWCPFKIQKEKRAGVQFTRTDVLSLVLTPLRNRWTIPLSKPVQQISKEIKIARSFVHDCYSREGTLGKVWVCGVESYFLYRMRVPPTSHHSSSQVAGGNLPFCKSEKSLHTSIYYFLHIKEDCLHVLYLTEQFLLLYVHMLRHAKKFFQLLFVF
jgi:hypothetical protein